RALPCPTSLGDGPAQRDRPPRASARESRRVGPPHHRQRTARRAGDQGARVALPRPRSGGGLQARTGDQQQGLPDRGRQGGPPRLRREAGAHLAGEVTVDPRTPCLIGVAQRTWRLAPGAEATDAPEPLDMWEEVARAAADDSGNPGLLSQLESLQVVDCPT